MKAINQVPWEGKGDLSVCFERAGLMCDDECDVISVWMKKQIMESSSLVL